MRQLVLALAVLVCACNTASDLRRWYAPTDGATRQAKLPEQVTVFENEPPARKFLVVGIFAPPAGAFQSLGEAINGARRAAALYGSDAVIVDTAEVVALERVSALEPSEGVKFKARAIIWQ